MWMFAGRAMGPLRDRPAVGPHRYQPGSGRTNHRGRLLLRIHGNEEQLGQLLDQILTIAPPTWCTKDVGGKRHLWDHWNPYYDCGALDREKSRTSRQRKGDLPKSGPQRCVKPYDPGLVVVLVFLSSRTSSGCCEVPKSRIPSQYAMGLLL